MPVTATSICRTATRSHRPRVPGSPSIYSSTSPRRDGATARRRDSRARVLQQALHNSSEAFLLVDGERRIDYVNPACEELLGYRAEEIVGQPVRRLWPPQIIEEADIAFRGGEPWSGESSRLHRDGREIPVLITLAPVRDESGDVTGHVVSMADLRGIKEVQERQARQTHELGERVKELRCLYQVAMLAVQSGLSLVEIFKKTIELLRRAYQYP